MPSGSTKSAFDIHSEGSCDSTPYQRSPRPASKSRTILKNGRLSLKGKRVDLATASGAGSRSAESHRASSKTDLNMESADVNLKQYNTLRRFWSTWCRPSVPRDYQRIEWTCVSTSCICRLSRLILLRIVGNFFMLILKQMTKKDYLR